MGCLTETLTEQVNSALIELGINKDELLSLDRKAVDAAICNGLLDFPLANQLIDNTTAFVTSLTTGLANSTANELVDRLLGTALATLGSIATVTSAIMSGDAEIQLLGYSFLIENLKRELKIRLLYYELLLFHIRSLLVVLQSYDTRGIRPNYRRLQLTYPYVVRAHKLFVELQRSAAPVKSGGARPTIPLKIRSNLISDAFRYIKTANDILNGTNSVGMQVAVDLKKSRWSDFDKAKATLSIEYNRRVLANTVYMFETIAWNISRLALLIPLPFTGLAYTAGSLISDTTLSGVPRKTFNSTEADALIEDIKNARGVGSFINAVDAAKGLTPTNVLIKGMLSQISTYEADFGELVAAARTLMMVFSPAIKILETTKKEMGAALEAPDIESILAGKEAQWIVQLKSLDAFKKVFGQSLKNAVQQAITVDAANRLKSEIVTYQKTQVDDTILKNILVVMETVVKAPFSNRALTESRVLCKSMLKLVQQGINSNIRLLTAASAVAPVPTAEQQLFSELMQAMSVLPPPASEIAKGITTGQLGIVTSALGGIVSSGKDLLSSISALSAKCSESVASRMDGSIMVLDLKEYDRRLAV